jgi:Predicted integral membrane protein (DUF2269)
MFPSMIASITAYGIGKFIHVLAVVLAFGPTYAYPVFAAVAQRLDPRSVPTVLRGIMATEKIFVIPGLVVLLAAGIYSQAEGPWEGDESWLSVGYLAILLLLAMTFLFFRPRTKRALEIAERDLKDGGELSADFEAISKRIALGGQIASVIVIVTIFFMVVKP